jgi:hypothetical protein
LNEEIDVAIYDHAVGKFSADRTSILVKVARLAGVLTALNVPLA